MNLTELSLNEKLDLAITTTETIILEMLLLSPNMLVRRALLRNNNITSEIVNSLAFDCVENVSYIANNHSKCTESRTFNLPVSICVKCKVDERHLSCDKCPYK
jgi:hypothetical protein